MVTDDDGAVHTVLSIRRLFAIRNMFSLNPTANKIRYRFIYLYVLYIIKIYASIDHGFNTNAFLRAFALSGRHANVSENDGSYFSSSLLFLIKYFT